MSQLKIKDNNNQWVDIPAGGVGVPSGGNTGDILVKSSSTDYATEWGMNTTLIMGIPDYDNAYYVDDLTTANGVFTVPEDGYMHFTYMPESSVTSAFYNCQLVKGNLMIRDFAAWQSEGGAGNRGSFFGAVSKGCVLTCVSATNMDWGTTYNYKPLFIPCKRT